MVVSCTNECTAVSLRHGYSRLFSRRFTFDAAPSIAVHYDISALVIILDECSAHIFHRANKKINKYCKI